MLASSKDAQAAQQRAEFEPVVDITDLSVDRKDTELSPDFIDQVEEIEGRNQITGQSFGLTPIQEKS